MSSPKLVGKQWAESPGRRLPSGSSPKRRKSGVWSAGAVLGAEAASLLAPRQPSPESFPTSRPRLTHSLQGGSLDRGHKGPRVHQEFVHVAEKMGSAPSVPEPPTPPPNLWEL